MTLRLTTFRHPILAYRRLTFFTRPTTGKLSASMPLNYSSLDIDVLAFLQDFFGTSPRYKEGPRPSTLPLSALNAAIPDP